MIDRAGYQELSEDARRMDMSGSIDELSAAAKILSVSGRKTVMHDRGEGVVEAGPIRFGVE